MKVSNYDLYLKSEHWIILREKIKSERNQACELCGSPFDLHVHHLTYKRLFREWSKDLLVVCSGCHRELHNVPDMGNKPVHISEVIKGLFDTLNARRIVKGGKYENEM